MSRYFAINKPLLIVVSANFLYFNILDLLNTGGFDVKMVTL